jgi:hypothetical protein
MSFGLAVATAPPASADVLLSPPQRQICAGKPIKVGVWYQSYSGGPRAYRIDVYNPNGHRIFHVKGKARSARWQYWKVPTSKPGRYKTIFRGSSSQGPWRDASRTRAFRC